MIVKKNFVKEIINKMIRMFGLHLISSKIVIFFIFLHNHYVVCDKDLTKNLSETPKFVKIEGKASLRQGMYVPFNWYANSRVLLDYGKYIGFIK